MARTVTVTLDEPRVDIDESRVTEVVLREPNLREMFALGEPIEIERTKSGEVLTIEHPAVLKAYLDILVVKPSTMAVVNGLGLSDALKIKDAIIGFFLDARLRASSRSQTGSSSTPASSTPAPAES